MLTLHRGFTLTYGAFQSYYRTTLLSSETPSAISWIGTVQAWLLIFIGVLSGPLFDLGYFRSMLIVGNFLVVFGIMMLSLSTTYWQVFLSQGVCMGLGAGLLYIPSLALVGVWFSRKRALAMGIVMSGIAVGGVIYIIMFDRLTKRAGFPWAIRAIGSVALVAAMLSIPALLSGSSMLASKRKARRLFDKSALHDKLFLTFTASTFFTFLGYIVPYFYIPTYARERLGTSDSLALYMLVFSIAGSFFGRLVSGVFAHYLGAIVTWIVCTFSSGILALSWISIEKESTFIAFSVLWGMIKFHLDADLTDTVRRLLLSRVGHSSVCCFRKYHARSLAAGYAIRDVMERVEYCVTHRRTHRGRTVEEERWTNRLHRSTSVVRRMFNDRDSLVTCSLHCNCPDTKERLESIGMHQHSYT
jgi:MFS family permease